MIRWCGTFLAYFLNLLPQAWLLKIGDAIGFVWFDILRIRRQVALENLELALGDSLGESERIKLARRNFQHYGRVLVEMVQSLSWGKEDFERHMVVDTPENLWNALKEGKGAYILSPHLGNWELGLQMTGLIGLPVDIVVKRAQTKMVQKFLEWYRTRTGLGQFWETRTTKEIFSSIAKGRGVVCVLDQFMGPPIGLPVTFFGKKAGTAVGLALLSEKRDAPVVPAYNFRDAEGKLHMVMEPPLTYSNLAPDRDGRLFQKTQAYNDALERAIRKYPDQWLWIHRRWKAYRGSPRWSSQTAAPSEAGGPA